MRVLHCLAVRSSGTRGRAKQLVCLLGTPGSLELSAEHFGRMDYPPSILGRELLVPSCAHAVMLPGVSRLAPQARSAVP